MKLYYAPGTCSLAPAIVAVEAGIALDLEHVDILKSPHVTAGGADYVAINPNGYVPALMLDDGSVLTEGAAIVQYLADLRPQSGLVPAAGTPGRYRLQAWLTFIGTELHKMYSPWLFHPEYGEPIQAIAREKISRRLLFVEASLAASGPFLMGGRFTAADAYLFTVVGWSEAAKVGLAAFPALQAFRESVGARPKVREAMALHSRTARALATA
jgi:glutathione S-transferase